MLLALYIFGGEVIRNFNLAMLLGVVIGTYSSIFIGAPLLGYLGVKRDWTAPATSSLRRGAAAGAGGVIRRQTLRVDTCATSVRAAMSDPEGSGHSLLRALAQSSNGSFIRIVSSRSGLVESSVTGHSISSSMVRTYLTACAGSSVQLRAPRVDCVQPSKLS